MTTTGVSVHEAQDSDGRELLAFVSAPYATGGVRWAIERSDFFAALRAEAGGWRVLIARDNASGEAIGYVSIATRRVWLGGCARTTWYLTNLHVRPDWRGRGVADALCRRAQEIIRSVGGEHAPTLLVVHERNHRMHARASGPRGLPGYNSIGRLAVYTTSTRRLRRVSDGRGTQIGAASPSDLAEMAALSNRVFSQRDFAPHLDAETLERWIGGAPGLSLSDFLVAREGGRMVGWLGLWDEAAFRRARVTGYTRFTAMRYRVRDALSPVTGWRPTPKVGELVSTVSTVRVCVDSARPDILRALLGHRAESLYRSGYSWLKIGLDPRDTLVRALAGLHARTGPLRAYITTPAGASAAPALDGRPLHFDAALA
jgi:ribosomal protein S18 acetylase RimI-like enzyme